MGQYSFKLPDVGEGTAEAEIAAWRVEVGDRIEEDAPLVDMMTDKATVELTSPVSGIVKSIAGKAGQMAAVGSVLVVIETEGEGSGDAAPAAAAAPAKAAPAPAPKPAPAAAPQPAAKAAPVAATRAEAPKATHAATQHVAAPPRPTLVGGRPVRPAASPAVRRRAEELGVKLQFVNGSGPGGRISHEDLDTYITTGDAANAPVVDASYAPRTAIEEVPVIGLRRQIAERMQLAKRQIPHFSYVEEVDVTELESLRAHLNATKTADQPKLTVLPFFIRALVRILPEFPQINATYDDEAGIVRRYAAVHAGMATQTPKGLMVAVIKHAETRDLWNCATEITRLSKAARDGKATRDELTGSTITVTSLGPLGGVVTTPVINRPEVAIVGPNKIVERPVVRNGQIVVRKMMNLSSSFDHRVVDGMDAAEFIQRVKDVLEHPATLFMP